MDLLSIEKTRSLIAEGAWIIDARPSAIFVQGMIPRSVHVPHTADFARYLELLIEPDIPLVLVAEPDQQNAIAKDLIRTGFANLIGIVDGGYDAWLAAGGQSDLIIDINAEEFELDFEYDEFYLIDLRADDQYEESHLEYAESLPLEGVEEAIPDLSPDMMYYFYGESFEDAAFAAALFKRDGFHKLRVVSEGYEALKKTKIPQAKKKKKNSDQNFSAN
jgi:rhodanese-related sulfurtransferase